MAERRRGLPVGVLIAAPPVLAALYFAALWLPFKLVGWSAPVPLLAPLVWLCDGVLQPVADTLGWDLDAYDATGWAFAGILGLAWSAAFLPVGLLLAGVAALVNLLWSSGGSDGKGG